MLEYSCIENKSDLEIKENVPTKRSNFLERPISLSQLLKRNFLYISLIELRNNSNLNKNSQYFNLMTDYY